MRIDTPRPPRVDAIIEAYRKGELGGFEISQSDMSKAHGVIESTREIYEVYEKNLHGNIRELVKGVSASIACVALTYATSYIVTGHISYNWDSITTSEKVILTAGHSLAGLISLMVGFRYAIKSRSNDSDFVRGLVKLLDAPDGDQERGAPNESNTNRPL